MNIREEMRNLITSLNHYTELYNKGDSPISDKKWDDMYFQLKHIEEETGIIYPDSPTVTIQMDAVASQSKVKHSKPMLSLAKTKDSNEFFLFGGGREALISLKMDGLSLRLTYEGGHLVQAETRGNGEEGNLVTYLMSAFKNVPMTISYKGRYEIDGECIITYDDFNALESDYKNPRNLAAGSMSLLDPKEAAKRNLQFVAWRVLTEIEDTDAFMSARLDHAALMGFTTVPYVINVDSDINEIIEELKARAKELSYPIDGLVSTFDEVAFGEELGVTGHHPKHSLAYKFYDEEYETRLKYIEWSMGRTGVLTPVAVFEPIDMDGTTVERASLHNYSVMKEIMGDCCYCGQKIKVFKANMIIPQISSAVKMSYGDVVSHGGITCDGFSNDFGLRCPACKGETGIEISDSGVENIVCLNPQCDGKLINRLDHFFGKKGLDVKGLSKATFEKLINWGWVASITDVFRLDTFRHEWENKEGFGEKSVGNILRAIEEGSVCTLDRVIAASGIPLIGTTVSKQLSNYCNTYTRFRDLIKGDFLFSDLEGFGPEMNYALKKFDYSEIDYIVENFLTIENKKEENKSNNLQGKTFVITGKLSRKRDDIKADIEAAGGRVVGSVSGKTDYLVCNDKNSTTGKSATAAKLGVPVISEEELMQMF